jgi:hypothetical protein
MLVTANVVPNSPILVILIMEALSSSETAALTRAARRNIPEDAILHIKTNSVAISPLVKYTDRWTAADSEDSAEFAGTGCCIVSATGTHGRFIRFSRPEPLLIHPSSALIILTMLSGPVPDPLLVRKSGSAGNRTRNLWICS